MASIFTRINKISEKYFTSFTCLEKENVFRFDRQQESKENHRTKVFHSSDGVFFSSSSGGADVSMLKKKTKIFRKPHVVMNIVKC